MNHDLLPFRNSLLQPLRKLEDLTSHRSHPSPISLSANEARREALKVVDRRRWRWRRKVETESELVLERRERSEETGRKIGNGRGVGRGDDGRIRGGGWVVGGELNGGEGLSERLRRRGFVVLVMMVNSVRVMGMMVRLRVAVVVVVMLVVSPRMMSVENGGRVVESHRVGHFGLIEGLDRRRKTRERQEGSSKKIERTWNERGLTSMQISSPFGFNSSLTSISPSSSTARIIGQSYEFPIFESQYKNELASTSFRCEERKRKGRLTQKPGEASCARVNSTVSNASFWKRSILLLWIPWESTATNSGYKFSKAEKGSDRGERKEKETTRSRSARVLSFVSRASVEEEKGDETHP